MKERDGGNDAITDAFDAKIKKVYETVELKANADRLEEVFKTSSEEIELGRLRGILGFSGGDEAQTQRSKLVLRRRQVRF